MGLGYIFVTDKASWIGGQEEKRGCLNGVSNRMDGRDIYHAGKGGGKNSVYTAKRWSRRLFDTGCCMSGERSGLEI